MRKISDGKDERINQEIVIAGVMDAVLDAFPIDKLIEVIRTEILRRTRYAGNGLTGDYQNCLEILRLLSNVLKALPPAYNQLIYPGNIVERLHQSNFQRMGAIHGLHLLDINPLNDVEKRLRELKSGWMAEGN